MSDYVESEYHGHPIVRWAVEETCYFCTYPASHKVEESYKPSAMVTHSYTAYVCCNHFWSTCFNDQAPACPKCRHPWYFHEEEITLHNLVVVSECDACAEPGDWCGCKEKKPV